MRTNEDIIVTGSNKKATVINVIGAMAIAAIGLIGYVPGFRLLGSIRPEFIPMAPSTAISFILLGSVLLVRISEIGQAYRRWHIIITSMVAAFGLLKFAEYCGGTAVSFEEVIIGQTAKLGEIPIGIMSPSTGAIFFLAGGSILLDIFGHIRKRDDGFFEHLSGMFGCTVFIGAFTFILGYLYGTPLLYGAGRTVPMALTTAAAFFLLGLGLINAKGKKYFPLMLFAGNSVRPRMMRVFLPVVIIAVIGMDALGRLLPQLFAHTADPIVDAFAVTSFAIITGIVVMYLGRELSKSIDQAEMMRKQAEEELRESEENLSITLRSIGDAVIATDPEGRITRMNPVAEKLTGWPLGEAQGKELPEVFRIINEDTRAEVENPVSKVLREGKMVGLANHTLLIAKDGSERPIADSGAPIVAKAGGEIRGVVLVFRDQTEERKAGEALRESEEKFRTLYVSSRDAVMMLTPEKGFFSGNPATVAMFACKDEAEFTAQTLADLSPERQPDGKLSPDKAQEMMAIAMRDGSYFFEWTHKRADGTEFPATVLLTRMELRGEAVLQATVRDITARKQMEEQLRHAEKMEAIGQLAGGIAHDFNNQLTGMLGYADMLANGLEDEKFIKYAEKIKRCASRASDLTNQLLAFARKGDFKNIPTDIHKTIADVVSLVEHSVDKRIYIRQQLDANPSMTIGDPTQLQSLLLNLALNAGDAMPAGGDLTFSTDVVTLDEAFGKKALFDIAAGRYLKIAVSDTGSGMDAETRKHIFEPFFTTKDIGKGTGMGLAGVYGAVERHQGTVTVETKLGEGSTFTVYLPLAEAEEVEGAPVIKSTPAKVIARVLVVDDEEIVREIVTDMLRELGYKVTTAKDGKEAVKYYQDSWEHVDLVLLDMSMPEMGGRDTFVAMRKINPEIKAILSSGYDLTLEAQEILDEGVLAFVHKPFEPAELSEKVAQVLRVAYASR